MGESSDGDIVNTIQALINEKLLSWEWDQKQKSDILHNFDVN